MSADNEAHGCKIYFMPTVVTVMVAYLVVFSVQPQNEGLLAGGYYPNRTGQVQLYQGQYDIEH